MYTFKQQKKSASVIPLAILVGAAMGSAIGILFATRKGSESRKWVKDKVGDLKNIFVNDEMKSSDEEQSHQIESFDNTNADNRVKTMHATTAAGLEETTASKAAAMVNHLKHTKQENSHIVEPQ
jgi:gas vesicle protein